MFTGWLLEKNTNSFYHPLGLLWGCGTAPVHGKQMEWGSQFNASHNQDHSPKCCARAGFLVMLHKRWCTTSEPGWALWPCARQEGNARAVSVMEELALPVWFHSVALAAIRPTDDRQDRAAEVTCHLPPFTLLFLLTPELLKQFPLRRFTQWP